MTAVKVSTNLVPYIVYPFEVYQKIRRLVNHHPLECQWWHKVERKKDKNRIIYTVSEIFIPEQSVQAKEVESSPAEMMAMWQAIKADRGLDSKALGALMAQSTVWCHSHHNMIAKPSTQDDKQWKEQKESNLANKNPQIMIIWNQKEELFTRVFDPRLNLEFENVPVLQNFGLKYDDIDEAIDAKFNKKTTTTQAGTGTGGYTKTPTHTPSHGSHGNTYSNYPHNSSGNHGSKKKLKTPGSTTTKGTQSPSTNGVSNTSGAKQPKTFNLAKTNPKKNQSGSSSQGSSKGSKKGGRWSNPQSWLEENPPLETKDRTEICKLVNLIKHTPLEHQRNERINELLTIIERVVFDQTDLIALVACLEGEWNFIDDMYGWVNGENKESDPDDIGDAVKRLYEIFSVDKPTVTVVYQSIEFILASYMVSEDEAESLAANFALKWADDYPQELERELMELAVHSVIRWVNVEIDNKPRA